jgi:hypothetical protein
MTVAQSVLDSVRDDSFEQAGVGRDLRQGFVDLDGHPAGAVDGP